MIPPKVPQIIVDYWASKGYALEWVEQHSSERSYIAQGYDAIRKGNRSRVINVYSDRTVYWRDLDSDSESLLEDAMITFIRFTAFV